MKNQIKSQSNKLVIKKKVIKNFATKNFGDEGTTHVTTVSTSSFF